MLHVYYIIYFRIISKKAFYFALEVLGSDEEDDLFFEVDENGDAVAHDNINLFLLCEYAVGKTFKLLCAKECGT